MNFIREKYAKQPAGYKAQIEEEEEEDIEVRASQGTVSKVDNVDVISSVEVDIVESAYSTLGAMKTYNMIKTISADGHSCKVSYNASFPVSHTTTARVTSADPVIVDIKPIV